MTKFWDYDRHPYRPVECRDYDGSISSDVFIDRLGRIWFAAGESLRQRLPIDPLAAEKIPAEFWHPDDAKRQSWSQHAEQKRKQDDARAELALIP